MSVASASDDFDATRAGCYRRRAEGKSVIEPRDDLAPFINVAIIVLSLSAGRWAWGRLANAKRLLRIASSIAAFAAVAVILIIARRLL